MNNRTLLNFLICILSVIFTQNNVYAQAQAGQGNFNIPEINATITDPTNCTTTDAIITVTQPLGSNYRYSINNGTYQSSPQFLNLAPGQYSVKFTDNILSCTSKEKIIDINPIPCDLQPSILCDVFVDLKGLILTETSFNIVMSDKINEILSNLQLTNSSVTNILSQINSLDIKLDYLSSGGNQSDIFNVYNTSMYGDLSSFRIKTWAHEISGVNTANFSGSYQLLITLANGDVVECREYPLNLTTEKIEEDIPEEIEKLPLLSCNSTLDELPDDTELLPEAKPGELFYIKEFPILLTEVNPPTGGVYSGKGIIPLPFNSRYILVEFSNVKVDKNRKIKGTVRAIPGSPVSCSAPSVDFGGAICIPPPPPPSFSGPGGTDINGYNSYGFDPVTKKYKDGKLFDPNGFDFNGNYQGTEPPSPFNPQGCSRDKVDVDGNECDPTPNPPNP